MRVPMPRALRDADKPVYLRIGDWNPAWPHSRNHAMGAIEVGVSVYDLDTLGRPIVPAESEWASVDLAERLASDAAKHLVQGRLVGEGHDGEPLLTDVVVVGEWCQAQ